MAEDKGPKKDLEKLKKSGATNERLAARRELKRQATEPAETEEE